MESGEVMCDLCGQREALIYIQQIIGEEKNELNLCEVCASEKGIMAKNENIELSVSNILTELVQTEESKKKRVRPDVCPTCGTSADSMIKDKKNI